LDELLIEEEGGGIYTPPQNLTVASQKVRLKPEISPAKAGHTG
jgi:hypothetical protein